jgi:hypothetical protein
MIYIKIDNDKICGKTYKDVVRKLWYTSFDSSTSKKKYMVNMARRIERMYQKAIKSENYKDFIERLAELKIITIMRTEVFTFRDWKLAFDRSYYQMIALIVAYIILMRAE